jgi:hypothetical protein
VEREESEKNEKGRGRGEEGTEGKENGMQKDEMINWFGHGFAEKCETIFCYDQQQ